MGFLKHDPEGTAQVRLLDLVYIDIVISDLAVLDIIEAVDQIGDRGLAGACGPDQRDLFTGPCVDHDIVKDHLVISVAEIDVVESDVTFQFLVSRAVVGLLVIVFPGPLSRMFLSLNDIAVFIVFAVDQHDVSLVGLRLFIQEIEDTLRAGQRHDDAVELHADLVDRHAETLVESEEARKAADRKSGIGVQCQQRSYKSHNYVIGISHLGVHRSDHVRESVGLVSALIQFLVQLVKRLDRFLLVAEYLDDLLACHRLLNKAVELTDIFLLRDKVPSRPLSHLHRGEQHQRHHRQCQECQRYVQDQHHGQNTDDRDRAVEQLRDTLADHLSERINIIGVDRHDVAVGMRVKIFNREGLHMIEQILPESF